MDLRRCAAGTTTEGESSKLMEATEPMKDSSVKRKAESDAAEEIEETEPIKGSSVKRKAESDPADETEESGDETEESGDETEESGDEMEDVDDDLSKPPLRNPAKWGYDSGDEKEDVDNDLSKPPWWNPSEWGYDSYDEAEYDSEEMAEFDDPEREREWRRCKRQLFYSKGFYLEPYDCRFSPLKPVGDLDRKSAFGQTGRELYADMANVCLQRYNQEKGLNVELVEVVRCLFSRGPIWKSYITFMAREKPDGPLVPYQAKVLSGNEKGMYFPILCRPEPNP